MPGTPPDDTNPWDPEDGDAAVEGRDQPEAPPVAVAEGDEPVPDDDEPEDRRRIIAVAAVAFVLIAVVGALLTFGGDDDDPTTGPTTTPGSQVTDGAGGTVTIVGTRDAFDRDDTEDGLGAVPSGAEWIIDAGGWAIRGGEVVLTTAATKDDQALRNFATIGTGYADPQAQVKLAKVVNGAGLAFRYRGECNHFVVYAVPQYAVWNVEKVVDCKRIEGEDGSQVFRKIVDAPVADGTTVGVVLDGDEVQIVINGRVVLTFTDDALAGAGRVGLTVRGEDATSVRFDDFVGGGPEGQAILGAKTGEGGTTTSAPAGTPTTGG